MYFNLNISPKMSYGCLSVILLFYTIPCLWFCNKRVFNKKGGIIGAGPCIIVSSDFQNKQGCYKLLLCPLSPLFLGCLVSYYPAAIFSLFIQTCPNFISSVKPSQILSMYTFPLYTFTSTCNYFFIIIFIHMSLCF